MINKYGMTPVPLKNLRLRLDFHRNPVCNPIYDVNAGKRIAKPNKLSRMRARR